MNAAIYTRISKDPDGTQAGVTRQEKDCRALVKQRGWDLVEVFVENDTSAFNGKRPEWRRLMEAIEAGEVRAVVAWSSDRLYRRVRDQVDLMEALAKVKGTIATVKDGDLDPASAMGQGVMGILANIAAMESGRRSERLVAKHAEIRDRGDWPGGRPPFGYRRDGASLKGHAKEAKLLREAAAAILDGESLRSVGERVLGGMNGTVLKRILMSPTIAARREYDGTLVKASWQPILATGTWRRVRELLADPSRGPKGPRPRYLLSGLAFCGSCGERLVGHPNRRVKSYACIRPGCPKQVRAKADDLDRFVLEHAEERTVASTEVRDPSDVAESLRDELDVIEERLAAWSREAAQAGLSAAEIRVGREPLVARRQEIEEEIARRTAIVTFKDRQGRNRASISATARRRRDNAKEGRPRDARADLETKVERIVLRSANRNRYMPLADRVEIEWR